MPRRLGAEFIGTLMLVSSVCGAAPSAGLKGLSHDKVMLDEIKRIVL
jgi:glycerol uptake facilitator-like aquaporin